MDRFQLHEFCYTLLSVTYTGAFQCNIAYDINIQKVSPVYKSAYAIRSSNRSNIQLYIESTVRSER